MFRRSTILMNSLFLHLNLWRFSIWQNSIKYSKERYIEDNEYSMISRTNSTISDFLSYENMWCNQLSNAGTDSYTVFINKVADSAYVNIWDIKIINISEDINKEQQTLFQEFSAHNWDFLNIFVNKATTR